MASGIKKKVKNEKKSKTKLFLVLIALFFLILALILFSYRAYRDYTIIFTKEVPMALEVGSKLGFDVNESYLNFGIIIPGAKSEKTITVANTYNSSLDIELKVYGSISKFIEMDEDKFKLERAGNKTVKIVASAPENAAPGNYSGKLLAIFRR